MPLRLLQDYCGYMMAYDYAEYNVLALQPGAERLAYIVHGERTRKFFEAKKVQTQGKTGRAAVAPAMIKNFYGI